MIPHRQIHETELARLWRAIRDGYGWARYMLAFAGVGGGRRGGKS